MQVSLPEFVEKTDYAYAVGRVRALETNLLTSTNFGLLLSAPAERFFPLFAEIASIKGGTSLEPSSLLNGLEESFTETLYLVKSLLLEDEVKRLVSLNYDYELLKLIVKEEKGVRVRVTSEAAKRASVPYDYLKYLLGGGRVPEVSGIMYRAYVELRDAKEARGALIDHTCDLGYFSELFQILDGYANNFIKNYFILCVDAVNILTMFRLKLRGAKKSAFRERYVPFGKIECAYLEQGFDSGLESFAYRIILSPLSSVLKKIGKAEDEDEQIALVEKHLEEGLIEYLRASIGVTLGVEPLLTYLWLKEVELKNLRIILLAKEAGLGPGEIKKHLRGFYG